MELKLNKKESIHSHQRVEDFSFLKDIVNINSYTYDLDSIRNIQNLIKLKFEKLSCRVEQHFNEEEIPLLEISFGNKELVPITLISHSDCVQIADEISQFQINDNKITGSGVIDNKAAIYISYSLINGFIENKRESDVHLRVLIYPSEERGSIGFENISKKLGETGKYFLGLEPALEDESIIDCRGGNRWYEFTFSGNTFHSGRIGKSDLNLGHYIMQESLRAVQKINSIEGVKFNLTHIQSNDETFNTTIDKIVVRFDLRFLDNSKRDEIDLMLKNDFFKLVMTESSIHDDCPAMEDKGNSHELLVRYQSAIGKSVEAKTSYGAADINYISNSHNICMDGLGAVGGNMHGKIEYLCVDAFKVRIKALEQLILEIANVCN